MPENPNSSFIPRQGPTRPTRRTSARRLSLLAILSYVSIGSVLLASVGLFFYDRYVKRVLATEVQNLSGLIGDFDEAEMERVRVFDARLKIARARLDNAASINNFLTALEQATVRSATIENLTLNREGDATFVVEAKLRTNSYDSAFFQRSLLERNAITESIQVEDLTLLQASEESVESFDGVTFTARIVTPVSSLKMSQPTQVSPQPVQEAQVETPAPEAPETAETQESSDESPAEEQVEEAPNTTNTPEL